MTPRARLIFVAAAIGLAGCAAAPPARPAVAPVEVRADRAVASEASARRRVHLDALEPRVSLPPGKGSSVGLPPLEAVHLYARAQLASLDRDREEATSLLEKAVALDPMSYELRVALGRLYLQPGVEFCDQSIASLEKAAELEPDHIDLQTDLGRQYLAKGDVASALTHFRLALQTRQYASDGPAGSVAEFFLATILRNEGYDEAALEVYQRLARHLKSATLAMRSSGEVAPLREHLDAIDGEIADLLARTGRYDDAAAAYAALIAGEPGNFDLRNRQVHLLIMAHHRDKALRAAEETAIHFRADAQSVALLNEACEAAGHTDGAAGALSRLHETRPGDRAILYSWIDALRADKRDADAEKVLEAAAARDPDDFQLTRRRALLALDRGNVTGAARLLIHAAAASPDLTAETAPLWSSLARPSSRGRLRWSQLKALEVAPDEAGAKWFWVERLAAAAHRDDIAEDALGRAVSAGFFPAFRDRLEQIWSRDDLDQAEKTRMSAELATKAEKDAGASAADELGAMSLMRQNKPSQAAALFSRAMKDPHRKTSPDLVIERAGSLRTSGDDSTADSLLWKLVNDRPTLRDAYEDLYLASISRNLESQAEHVVTTWLMADPQSVTARRIQAIQYQRAGRNEAAEAILVRLFNDHADDPEAVGAITGFYLRRHHADKLIPLLEKRHADAPGNIAVSAALVDALVSENRSEEAARVLDAARGAALDDPDLLYSISALYARVGKKDASEDVLSRILKLDPSHPGAANDLGYSYAEAGRNLPEAEALIRKAVKAEPQNASYLDSLGWILYKRGKWSEARDFLDRAISPRKAAGSSRRADPVVLNHRGDVLYRLGEKEAAASDWTAAADYIAALKGEAGDEMKELQAQLLEKARQARSGKAVKVAPAASAEEKPQSSGSRSEAASDKARGEK